MPGLSRLSESRLSTRSTPRRAQMRINARLRFGLMLIPLCFVLAQAQVKDYAVHPAPLASVHVNDEFWTPRIETNRNVTLWHVFKQAEEAGEFDNFAKAAGAMEGPFRGSSPARDSDAYKTI